MPAASPCTCARLRRAARALTRIYDAVLAPSKLRVTQYSLLAMLEREGSSRIGDLADALLLDRTALSRNLAPLAARRLVAIAPGPDARTREIALTPAGRAAIAAARPRWRDAQADVAKRLGAKQLATLTAALDRLETMSAGASPRARRPMRAGSPR